LLRTGYGETGVMEFGHDLTGMYACCESGVGLSWVVSDINGEYAEVS